MIVTVLDHDSTKVTTARRHQISVVQLAFTVVVLLVEIVVGVVVAALAHCVLHVPDPMLQSTADHIADLLVGKAIVTGTELPVTDHAKTHVFPGLITHRTTLYIL